MCTSFLQFNQNHEGFIARTMDWYDKTEQNVIFVPRQYQWSSVFSGQTITNQYAALGVGHPFASLDQQNGHVDLSDGINEHGLVVQKLTYSKTGQFNQGEQTGYLNLYAFEFCFWLLTNFKSVEDVLNGLDQVRLAIPPTDQKINLHFMAADPTGRFIVIDPSEGKLVTMDNPTHVITNAPNLNTEIDKLAQYLHFSPEFLAAKQPIYPTNRIATDDFSGLKKAPGGFSPSDRFIRTVINKERTDTPITPKDQMVSAWSILNSVTVPKQSERSNTYTIYRSGVNLTSRELFFQRYDELAINSFQLDDQLIQTTAVKILG